jgi:MFS transporter, DHA1 family, inner membrane transport protein
MSTEITASGGREHGARATEGASSAPGMLTSIWPLVLIAMIGNLPNPSINIFVGSLAHEYGVAPSTIGGMRSLGGGAALLVGFFTAPLLDRFPRAATVLLGLVFVVFAASLPLTGNVVALMLAFGCLGAALAIVMPAAQAACGDFFDGPEAGQAASLVQASQTTANVVAGPILTLVALVGGWHGAYASVAVIAVIAMALVVPRLSWHRPRHVARTGYRQAYQLVARAPGAVPLLLSSTVRACTIQAWLAFLAATLTERFNASAEVIATFWFIGAGCVVLANLIMGRMLKGAASGRQRWWSAPEPVLIASMALMIAVAPPIYLAPDLPSALVACIVFCLNVGVGIAALIAVLMARYAHLRGAVMGLNATGQNVGIVVGTSISSVALGIGGYPALAATLSAVSALALGIFLLARRSLGTAANLASEPL